MSFSLNSSKSTINIKSNLFNTNYEPENFNKRINSENFSKSPSKKNISFNYNKENLNYSNNNKVPLNNKIPLTINPENYNICDSNNKILHKNYVYDKNEKKNKKIPLSEEKIVVNNNFYNNSKKLFFIINNSPLINGFNYFKTFFKLPNIVNSPLSNKEMFYEHLTKNIINLNINIENITNKLFKTKLNIYTLINKLVINCFNTNENEFFVDLYGSFMNGLCIESSDVDILIRFKQFNLNCSENLINILCEEINKLSYFKIINKLPHAKIPIIKLEFNLEDNCPNLFYETNIKKINIDICFQNTILLPNNFVPSLLIIDEIRKLVDYLPGSKYVIRTLKKLLKYKNLNNYYSGGLSSFSLFIMVFAFYKYKCIINKFEKNENLGIFFYQFIDFYSNFDFYSYGINYKNFFPYFIINNNHFQNIPIIIDPITQNNIGSGTFKIENIKELFKDLKIYLDTKYNCEEKDENILLEYIIK
jgi:hypothetical protein